MITKDDGSKVVGKMSVFAPEQLGPKQRITPEGFLFCEDVPLARTGTLMYGPGETPVPVGPEGITRIQRSEDEVFAPDFLMSFAGKPVVNNHPTEDVNPDNWKAYAGGTTLNPRRGTGALDQFIIGDLLICDRQMITDVQSGKREVSAGYEAQYDELGPGLGRQRNMRANHVALVLSGRCGPVCAIGDGKTVPHPTGDCAMPTLRELNAAVKAALATKDEAKISAAYTALDSAITATAVRDDGIAGAETLHLHLQSPGAGDKAYDALNERVNGVEGRLGAMDSKLDEISSKLDKKDEVKTQDAASLAAFEQELVQEAPAGKGPEAAKAQDSAYLGESFQETLALAEILAPGISLPTYDSKAAPKSTYDSICGLRKTALDLAYVQPEGRAAITGVLGGKPLELAKMSCNDVRSLFRAAGAVRKATNAARAQATVQAQDKGEYKGPPRNAAEMNARNTAHYAKH